MEKMIRRYKIPEISPSNKTCIHKVLMCQGAEVLDVISDESGVYLLVRENPKRPEKYYKFLCLWCDSVINNVGQYLGTARVAGVGLKRFWHVFRA